MREPNRYASVEEAHRAALEGTAEPRSPERAKQPDTPTPPDPVAEIEARLAAYDFVELRKVEAGLVKMVDYANGRLNLDQELAREIRALPTPAEFAPSGDLPTMSAEQLREAAINPEPSPAERQAEDRMETIIQGREVSEAVQARIDRLMDSGSDELELRLEQEIGNSPSRGRGP